MNKFTKNCPVCNVVIIYKSEKLLNQSIKRGSKCHRGCLGVLKNPSNKICAKCKEEKPTSEFGTIRGKINRHCKSCGRVYGKKSYSNNKQSRSKSSKKWQAKNPNYEKEYARKNLEVTNKKNKKWRSKNPDYDADYRKENKEEIKLRNEKWKQNNPLKVLEIARRRRAKKLEVNEQYSEEDNVITNKEFNYKCYNCKSNEDLTIDHHYPLSKGYPLTLTNAVVLCRSCNSSKGNKDPKDFYSSLKYIKLTKKLIKIGEKY
jgi:5-methylcytosine-specific restriction endonuclease McrA